MLSRRFVLASLVALLGASDARAKQHKRVRKARKRVQSCYQSSWAWCGCPDGPLSPLCEYCIGTVQECCPVAFYGMASLDACIPFQTPAGPV